jgi:hypothetical protein
MKVEELRIGSIVSVCYEKEIIPDKVMILEPNVVHLSTREYPDNEQDIIGVPLSEEWLIQFSFTYHSEFQLWQSGEILIKKLTNCWLVQYKSYRKEIESVHQLQDIVHFFRENK